MRESFIGRLIGRPSLDRAFRDAVVLFLSVRVLVLGLM